MNNDLVRPSEMDFKLAEQWENATEKARNECSNRQMYEEALQRVKNWRVVGRIIEALEAGESVDDIIKPANANAQRDVIDVSTRTIDLEFRKKKIGVYHMVEKVVSSEYNLTPSAIRGTCRRRDHAHARFTIAWIMNREFGWSLSRIGRMMRKDHSSILHGIRKLEAMNPENDIKIRAYGLRRMCISKFNEKEIP